MIDRTSEDESTTFDAYDRQDSSIDQSTGDLTSFLSEKQGIGIAKEFSADIRPLTFNIKPYKMTNKVATEGIPSSNNVEEDKPDVTTQRLRGDSAPIPTSRMMSIFNSIDVDEFENYLKDPKYIKFLKRGRNIKQFRRLFLAQEIKIRKGNRDNRGSATSNGLANASVGLGLMNHDNTQAFSPEAILVTRFSMDGKYMATGSKNGKVRIWKVLSSPIERWELDTALESSLPSSSTLLPSGEKRMSSRYLREQFSASSQAQENAIRNSTTNYESASEALNLYAPVFRPHPIQVYKEHNLDILDLDWSKNNFVLTASMDKTVKIWHPERDTSLKTFVHPDFVTACKFHPADDRFYVSGCLDHKCRLWSIVSDEIIYEFDCSDLITSITFSPGDGNFVIVGTFNGFVYVLNTDRFELHSSFHVKDKVGQGSSRRGINALAQSNKPHHGPRITDLACFRTPNDLSLKLMVTTRDSKIRIFDLTTNKRLETLKGYHSSNSSSHHTVFTIGCEVPVVIGGSEDHWVYVWRLHSCSPTSGGSGIQKGPLKRSSSLKNLTSLPSALSDVSSENLPEFSTATPSKISIIGPPQPPPETKGRIRRWSSNESGSSGRSARALISTILSGHATGYKNREYVAFHAHHSRVTSVAVAPPEALKALSLSNDFICELSMELSRESYATQDTNGRSHDRPRARSSSNVDSGHLRALGRMQDTPENDADPQSRPLGPAAAAGFVFVSTDATGTIRVFRSDIPEEIREKTLLKLEEYKAVFGNSSGGGSGTGCKLLRRSSSTFRNSVTRNKSLSLSLNSGQKFTFPSTDLIHRTSLGKRPHGILHPTSSALFNTQSNESSLAQSLPLRHSSTFGNADRIAPLYSENQTVNVGSVSPIGAKCEVCNGTVFKPVSKTSASKLDTVYYCVDCGTVLNNFR